MKELGIGVAALLLVLVITGAVLWFRFAVSNAAASVVVFDAEPGTRCVRVTTADGVAVDCWEVRQ